MTATPPKGWASEIRHIAADRSEDGNYFYEPLCHAVGFNFYVQDPRDLATAINPCQDCMAHPDYPLYLLGEL